MKKLCINCKHFRPVKYGGDGECWHPMNTGESLVDGQMKAKNSVHYLRDDHRMGFETCGSSGMWFAPAEEKAAA